MDLKARMQTLATMESQYPHILSVYLNCRDGGNDRKKENLIFLKNRAADLEQVLGDDKKGIDYLRKSLAQAEMIRDQDVDNNVSGLALFLKGDEVIERFETTLSFEDQMAYRRYPFISQLAFLNEEFEPYAVLHIDSRSARIFELAMGELVDSSEIQNEIRSRIDRGGWSQMRYQRAIEGEKHAHIKEVAEELTALVARRNYKRIIVIGPDKSRSILQECLSANVEKRIIDGSKVDSRANDKKLLDMAVNYFMQAEDEEEAAKMDRVVREIHSTTMGVSGLEDTLTYLARGQAYEVLLPHGLSRRGSQCDTCGMIFKARATHCYACESKEVHEVDLAEAVTRTAMKFGSKLEFVKNPSFQEKLGGAAALLRSPRMI
ncbi:Vms1/Ankzf1 family peptidyl-tRNA hydrolase [Planctomycetota bacterium]|nr:Vms1/Ankzf1 family peptidyl-tRNA hydrolase [Planctomycetota bacterium]